MEADGFLGRNFLKGLQGDAINAILCGAEHNLRKILARLRELSCLLTEKSERLYNAFWSAWSSTPLWNALNAKGLFRGDY